MILPLSRRSMLLGLFTLVLLAVNAGVVRDLVDFARGNATASHIVLVPLVTLVLLYQGRETIFATSRSAWPTGVIVILAGIALLIVGRMQAGLLTRENALSMMAGGMVVIWIGGFLGTYGWTSSRAALFPLLFLGFAIPMPAVVLEAVTELLKRGSTEMVASLFSVTNTPFHRDGFVFSLPGFSIEVADECSGIRSSIALVLTGLLAGHMYLRKQWTKTLLIIAVLPLTLLKNGIRIVTLTLLALHVDPGFLVGQLHHEGGFVFFLVSLAILAPLLPVLRRAEDVRISRTVKVEGAE